MSLRLSYNIVLMWSDFLNYINTATRHLYYRVMDDEVFISPTNRSLQELALLTERIVSISQEFSRSVRESLTHKV